MSDGQKCEDCGAPGEACPGCGKVVCQSCGDAEGEFCRCFQDPEIDYYLGMSDEALTLHCARAGISPTDMDRMWERCWASISAHEDAQRAADGMRWADDGGPTP